MKTRRSPRNQQRLWQGLGGVPVVVKTPTLGERFAAEERQLAASRPGSPAAACARRNLERLRIKLALQEGQSS